MVTTSSLLTHASEAPAREATETLLLPQRVASALGILLGVLLALTGFAWDVQWHTDVGPDSFFTAPHLVLYGGVAISGLTCLLTVLFTTWQVRRGNTAALEGATSILGGRFYGPIGYIVGGFGALFFLMYGGLDEWWHTLYGFDVTLVSPPHVGLIFSIMVTMAGALMALGWHVRMAQANGSLAILASIGLALAAAILAMFVTPTLTDLFPWVLFERISWPNSVISFLYPATILLVAVIVRRPWAGTLFGLIFTLLDVVLSAIIPVITLNYATSIGLFLRDNIRGITVVPELAPTYILLAGVGVDLVLALGRRQGWRVGWTVALAGAVAALAIWIPEPNLPAYVAQGAADPELQQRIAETTAQLRPASVIIVPLIGALAGWFGWMLGIVIRRDNAPVVAASGLPLQAAVVVTVLLLLLNAPTGVSAHPSDPHHETMQVGPYGVQVGFSEWPIQAERSIDITFEVDGGIADKSATLQLIAPDGEVYEDGPLGRHPRMRQYWGLDLIALPMEGNWTITLAIDGLEGHGEATLSTIPVGPRPGPPPTPIWLIATLPLFFLLGISVRGWRAVRPRQAPEANAWV